MTAKAGKAFVQALRQDRQLPQARWYLGLEAAQEDNPAKAIAIWRDLARASPPDAPWQPSLRQAMVEVSARAGIAPLSISPAHPLDLIDGVTTPEASTAATAGVLPPGLTPSLMVEKLRAELASQPNNFDGWMMLGRSLKVLKDRSGSSAAYAQAVALKPTDLNARYGYADALLIDAQASQQRPPSAFFETVAVIRAQAPNEADSLYLGGIAALAQGNRDEARRLWTVLRDGLPEGSDERTSMDAQLQTIAGAVRTPAP